MQVEKKKRIFKRFPFAPASDAQKNKLTRPAASGEFLPRLFQMNLQQTVDEGRAQIISNLWQSAREAQTTDAYLLLAEACAQAGLTEMALATLDVLSCVEPDRPEAERMKESIRIKNVERAQIKEALEWQI